MAIVAVYPDPVGGNPHQPKLTSPPGIYVARLHDSVDDDVIDAELIEETPGSSSGTWHTMPVYPDAVFTDGSAVRSGPRPSGNASHSRYRVIMGSGGVPPSADSPDGEVDESDELRPDGLLYRHFIVGVGEDNFGGLHLRCYLSPRARRALAIALALGFVVLTGKLTEVAELVIKFFF